MKALTIHEPYASLIIMGIKKLETRGHKTNVRGEIAIHAGKKPMDAEGKALAEKYGIEPQYGKVLGVAYLCACGLVKDDVKCGISWEIRQSMPNEESDYEKFARVYDSMDLMEEPNFGDLSEGRYLWALEVVEKFDEPIPAKGMQRWWNWERGA